MASSDVLGYPIKKHFYRLHLEAAWRAAFGALDIGDFETFLKESADRTYPDTLTQIRKMGAGRSESSQIKESKEYEAQGGIEQYRMVADNLRQEGKEYEASAIDALIADLIAAQSKPPRKTPEKREPKQKPLVVSLPEQKPEKPQPSSTDYIKDLCKKSPLTSEDIHQLVNVVKLTDIDLAIKVVRECKTLDEFDKYEIEETLKDKAMGILERKEMSDKQIHKLMAAKPKPEISTTRTRARKKKKEGGEGGEEEEPVPTMRRYQFNNLADANNFFKENGEWLREIIRIGVPEWIETHKKAAVGALSTQAVFALGNALEYAMNPIKKPDVRGLVAMDVMHKTKWLIVEHGLDFATKDYDWKKQYAFYQKSIKVDLEQFKKDVLKSVGELEFTFGLR